MENIISSFKPLLTEIVGEEHCLWDEPMAKHTTFRVGGPADCYCTPGSEEELRKVLVLAREKKLPYFVMGNGSNLLVSDKGFRGLVIAIGREMGEVRTDGVRITAEAGAMLSQIAAAARQASLKGFEFASGIPGTLGGACMMNAGAYGGEMKQVLKEVVCINEKGEFITVLKDEMGLGYRSSAFMENGWIVSKAVIELSQGDAQEIKDLTEELRKQRTGKQPLDVPSAGSTFKRPEGYFAGKLIMDAGLRGYRVGGACVSEKHCGFVVNDRQGTAQDILDVIRDVQTKVEAEFGVHLEPEVRFLGEF